MKKCVSCVAASTVLLIAGLARADDYQTNTRGSLVVDLRASDVFSDADNAIKTQAGAATGLHVDVGDSVMPTLGLTYFFTNKLSVEAILGTTEHTIRAEGAGTDVKVHRTWVIPPVITLKYHPMPAARISPYVGAGVNAMIFYGGDNYNGFKVGLRDNVGFALQAGADMKVKGPWSVNVDLKKVFVEDDAVIDGGALKSDVDLDPWVVSVGFGRKF